MNSATATLQMKSENDHSAAKRNAAQTSVSTLTVVERRFLWLSWQHPKMSRHVCRLWALKR